MASSISAPSRPRLTVPAGKVITRVQVLCGVQWAASSSGDRYRHVWVHKNGGLFFGTAKESDQGGSGVQSIGTGVVNVTPGEYFELIFRQTSGAAKNAAANELTWFAIEVVE